MKKISCSIISMLFLICLTAQDDINRSPYFFVNSEDSEVDQFSLLGTEVNANIAGPIADVTVTQRYKNDGKVPLEAIYVFPSSTRSAVYSMEMKIGERTIVADIKEKNQAQKEYQQAKSEGKRSSLLEQHMPNVFQMSVANILPGDLIEIEMKYNEFLIPTEGEYKFVYPTVVGPRYTNGNNTPSYVSNPYLKAGVEPRSAFDLSIHLNAPVPIKDACTITHGVEIKYLSTNELEVSLDPKEKKKSDRDFIFQYRFTDGQIASGTMLYEHGDENFFLSVIEPPTNFSPDQITPREYQFIVDVSGSMHGFPLEISKKLMENLLSNLRPNDCFNVLLFASNSAVMASRSMPATKDNITRATRFVNNQSGSGGTELLSAVKHAFSLPKYDENYSRSMVIITDGYVHVERETFEFIENNLDAANFFAFGIGSSVNRYLIEGIAHVGKGEPFIITDRKLADDTARKFKKYIESPLLTNIKIDFEGMDVYEVSPKRTPDLFAERPLYIFGKYKGKAKGKLKISGKQGDIDYANTIDFNSINPAKKNSAIRYLWAREKIRHLDDFNNLNGRDFHKEEITEIGLKYNLLTDYTSFLAIDHNPVVQNANTKTKTVRQALPMPHGVSNYAVGFEMGAEKIVNSNADLEEEILFVQLMNKEIESESGQIISLFEREFKYTDQELRDILDENILTFSMNEKGLEIIDQKGLLTLEMKKKLCAHLEELKAIVSVLRILEIKLIWL